MTFMGILFFLLLGILAVALSLLIFGLKKKNKICVGISVVLFLLIVSIIYLLAGFITGM